LTIIFIFFSLYFTLIKRFEADEAQGRRYVKFFYPSLNAPYKQLVVTSVRGGWE